MGDNSDCRAQGSATTIAVTSGKGGVGKTSLATNVAIALSRGGHRVCLFDADMGLANVTILLGIQPSATVDDVLSGGAELEQAVMEGPEGLHIVPAASGLERIGSSPQSGATLGRQLAALEAAFDYIIVDTPAGIGRATRSFVHSCANAALIITPEPTSLTDAFTLLKALLREGYSGQVAAIANMLPEGQDGERLFHRFHMAVHRHLHLDLECLGHIPMDRAVTRAVLGQSPLLLHAPESSAARHMEALAEQVTRLFPPRHGALRFSSYWAEAPLPGGPSALGTAERTEGETRESTVLTPPEEMQMAESDELEDLPSLGDRAERLLGTTDTDEGDARRFFAQVERAFTARYRRRASDIKAFIYEALLYGQLSELQHREILEAITTSYRQHYGREPAVAMFEAALDGRSGEQDAENARAYADLLWSRISHDPELASATLTHLLTEAVRAETWTPEASQGLVGALAEGHRERFGESLFREHERLRESLRDFRDMLQSRRHALERALTDVCVLLEEHAEVDRKLEQLLERDETEADTQPETGEERVGQSS